MSGDSGEQSNNIPYYHRVALQSDAFRAGFTRERQLAAVNYCPRTAYMGRKRPSKGRIRPESPAAATGSNVLVSLKHRPPCTP